MLNGVGYYHKIYWLEKKEKLSHTEPVLLFSDGYFKSDSDFN